MKPGDSMYHLLYYNEDKVERGEAAVLTGRNMYLPDALHSVSFSQKLARFERNMALNKRISKPTFHVSINPSNQDKLTDAQYIQVADGLMHKLGYGDQPFIVYRHFDIDREHVHVVSIRVDDFGKAIPNFNEKRKANDVRNHFIRELNLVTPESVKKVHAPNPIDFERFVYGRGELARHIKHVVRYVLQSHHPDFPSFTSALAMYNVIPRFNFFKGNIGIVYHAKNGENGSRVGVGLPSYAISKEAGFEELNKKFEGALPKCTLFFKTAFSTVYRDLRRNGNHYFESSLINVLPALKDQLAHALVTAYKIPEDTAQTATAAFIVQKQDAYTAIKEKEHRYFVGEVRAALSFLKNSQFADVDKSTFLASLQLGVIKEKEGYRFFHQKDKALNYYVAASNLRLPNVGGEKPVKVFSKQHRSLIRSLEDGEALKDLLRKNGVYFASRSALLRHLDEARRTAYLKEVNAAYLNQVFSALDPKQHLGSLLHRALNKGIHILGTFKGDHLQDTFLGFYGNGIKTYVTAPAPLLTYLQNSGYSHMHQDALNGIMLRNAQPSRSFGNYYELTTGYHQQNARLLAGALKKINDFDSHLGENLRTAMREGDRLAVTKYSLEYLEKSLPVESHRQQQPLAASGPGSATTIFSALFGGLGNFELQGEVAAGGLPEKKRKRRRKRLSL